jgi:hypothetical protein
MNGNPDSEPASSRHFKSSDVKKLSVDARIIIALLKQQPQKRVDLCKNAGIHPSSFSRCKRLLEGVIKETQDGFCLWNFTKPMTLWERLQSRLREAGGLLIDLEIEELKLGERDPRTGWCKKLYEKTHPVKGIIVLSGAEELEAAAKISVPSEYLGLLLTDGAVRAGDRFQWRGNLYVLQEVETILEGYEVSHRIAKLVERYIPRR